MNKIAILLVLFFVSLHSFAQRDIIIPPAKILTLNDIIISGRGNPIDYFQRNQSMTLLKADKLALLPSRSLSEALSYTSGVDVRQRGLNGMQADISIRGGSFEQTLILVNGFKMVDPQTGHHAMNIPFTVNAIDQIEVTKGPATNMFGQSALAGAVNFVSNLSGKTFVKAQTYAGSFGTAGINVTMSAPIKGWNQKLSMGFDRSNGHWSNSDFDNKQISYEGGKTLKKQYLLVMLAYSDRKFGANGFYSNKFPDQWESTQNAFAGLRYNVFFRKATWVNRLSTRTNRDEFRLKRNDPGFYTNRHFSETYSLESILNGKFLSNWQYHLGIEHRIEALNSSNLGLRNRQYSSAFGDVIFKTGKWTATTSLLVFQYSDVPLSVLPSIQCAFQLNEQNRLYANLAKSNRIPTYTELFYADPSNIGNPDLKPEYANSAELGWFKNGKLYLEGNVFYRQTYNMIDWVRDSSSVMPNPNKWKPVNIAEVRFYGLEATVRKTFVYPAEFKPNFLDLSYTYIQATHVFDENVESRYAYSNLKHQLIAKFSFQFSKFGSMQVNYRFIQRVSNPAYQLVDLKLISGNLKGFNLFVEANNLTNTNYVEAGFVQMPGRWFKVGLNYAFTKVNQ
ncbi:MAG: TonB-dependent receptor [Crocinitomicaceae bacterium]|nr:TonB-dependent receptor [Crocinitomicaceae bacterium]MBP6032431.1 TonB-dependent receptor [Crocinitomicaceae bacterium]